MTDPWPGVCAKCGAGLHTGHDCTIEIPKADADVADGTSVYTLPASHFLRGGNVAYVLYMAGQSNLWGQGSLDSAVSGSLTYKSEGYATPANVYIWNYLNSATPHSLFPPGAEPGAWDALTIGYGFGNPQNWAIDHGTYNLNDTVRGIASGHRNHKYTCILGHTASADKEPHVGANAATYWSLGIDNIGAEMQLAYRLKLLIGDIPLYILKLARGGSQIYPHPGQLDWSPGNSAELFDVWKVEYHRKGIGALYDAGLRPYFLGFYWGQGAGDVKYSSTAASEYPVNLKELFTKFREIIGLANAPFVAYRETPHLEPGTWTPTDLDNVRNGTVGVTTADPYMMWLDIDDIPVADPGPPVADEHWPGNSQVEAGNRAANVLLEYWRYRTPELIPKPS